MFEPRARRGLWLVLMFAALLRLPPLFFPIITNDGTIRLYKSVQWASEPVWYGLGGQWPPLVMYLQGLLIRWGADPVWMAHLQGYVISVATVYVAYLLGWQIFKDARIALVGAIAAAGYWYHIAFINMNLIENWYTLLLLVTLYLSVKALEQPYPSTKLMIGVALCIAGLILLRHEGRLVWLVLLGYALYQRQWRLAAWIAGVNGALLGYLLLENQLMRGHWMADLISARANFDFAAAAKERTVSLEQKLGILRGIFMFMPSIFFILLAFTGILAHKKSRGAQVVSLCSLASLGLLLFSAFTTSLIPFVRYFVPVFMPLTPLAGAGWATAARVSKWLALAMVMGMLLVQPFQWTRGWVRRYGEWRWTYLAPCYQQPPQQTALEQQIAALPLDAKVTLVGWPYAEWDIKTAILNTRRFDLMGGLRKDSEYDQYAARPTAPLILTRETLLQADYLVVHPLSKRAAELERLSLPTEVVYEADFLIVYKVLKPTANPLPQ